MGWESWNFGRSRPTARRRVPLRVSSVHCSVPQALKWDLGLQSHLKCEPSVFFSSQSFSILMQLNHYIPYFDHLFMWGLFSENLKFRKLSNIAIRLQCISNRMTQKNVCCVWHQLSCLDMMNKWDWKRLNWSPVLTPDKRKDWRTGPPKRSRYRANPSAAISQRNSTASSYTEKERETSAEYIRNMATSHLTESGSVT